MGELFSNLGERERENVITLKENYKLSQRFERETSIYDYVRNQNQKRIKKKIECS